MKIKLWGLLLGFSLGITVTAQTEIPVSTEMFVQLVFKSPIQNVKSGNPEKLLTEYSENSLTMQAIQSDFRTNIMVKTADGLYYSFIIKGTEDKNICLFYQIGVQVAANSTAGDTTIGTVTRKEQISNISNQEVAEKIYGQRGFIKSRNIADYKKIFLMIKGIYSYQDKLYFLMELSNDSNINYQVDKLRFATLPIDKSKKRIQSDEREYEPLFYHNQVSEIKGRTSISTVVVFNKFTLNNNKNLEITLTEDKGERTVRLVVPSDWISSARDFN